MSLKLGGAVGYRLLCRVKAPSQMRARHWNPAPRDDSWPMLSLHFGPSLWAAVSDRRVVDYGCGTGADAIELARRGARHVTGIDPDTRALEVARRRAEAAGVADRCTFTTSIAVTADVVVSCDTFEHVSSLERTLGEIAAMIAPGGEVWASFGPPWYHPKGGHIFSVFPWAHLIVSETAMTRWRSAFLRGAPIGSYREAGLNQMSIRRFLATVERSPLALEALELVPIRKLRHLGLHRLPLCREFTTAVVKCRLRPRLRAPEPGAVPHQVRPEPGHARRDSPAPLAR